LAAAWSAVHLASWAQGKAQTALEHAKQVSDEAVSAMPVATPVATPVAKPGEDEREV
jgi:hypothetical protein